MTAGRDGLPRADVVAKEGLMSNRARASVVISAVVAAVVASPAPAGIRYQAVTETVPEERPKGRMRMLVEGWVEGDRARIEFRESDNPIMGAGTYLLTQDGGRTLLLVDPEEKTYSRWDLEAMMGAAGALMEGMGPLLNVQISEPAVEKLLDEDGGAIHGRPTRHYRYRTTYTMKVKVMGMGSESAIEQIQDLWSTTDLADAGLGVWLRTSPRQTGIEDIDRLIAAEMERVQGFPLKTEVVATTTDKKGRQNVTRTRQEVTLLESASPEAAIFEVPAGFKEVPMAPVPGMDEGGEGGSPFPTIFGKKKDKDDG